MIALRRPTNGAGAKPASASTSLAAEIRATLTVAAPLVAANLSQMVMGLTSTVMVGRLGGTALAAAGLGGGLFFTLLLTCRSVLAAVAPLAAHSIGAGNHREAGLVAGAGLALAVIAASPVVVILSVLDRLLAALGYDPALAAEVGRYLAAIRWGAPAFLAFEVLRALLAASGRARVVMVALAFGIPANAVVSWALIFGRFGMPALDVAGAGYATAIIQWLMALGLIGFILLAPHRTPLRVPRRLIDQIRPILRLGLPIGGLVALETGVFATAGVLMGLLGADALGAHQLTISFASLTFMIPLGLGQAATVRVAFELGAKDAVRARLAGFVAIGLGTVAMIAAGLLIWAVPRAIAGLYIDVNDPANAGVVAIALQLLTVAALFQVVDGVQVVAAGALRGYRDTKMPMLFAVIGYWGVGFVGGWLLAFPLGYGALGLWWGLALGLAVVSMMLTLRLRFRAAAEIRA